MNEYRHNESIFTVLFHSKGGFLGYPTFLIFGLPLSFRILKIYGIFLYWSLVNRAHWHYKLDIEMVLPPLLLWPLPSLVMDS